MEIVQKTMWENANGNEEKAIVDVYLAKYYEFSICYRLAV